MYKILFLILTVVSLNAKMIDAVAIVVQNQPITTYEITALMQKRGLSQKQAVDFLIRKTLENIQIKQRNITVTQDDIVNEIKRVAAINHMSVEQFYTALQNSNGMTVQQIQKKTKERLLNQKLFQAIAFAHMYAPSSDEIQNYFKLHKHEFEPPSSYNVIIYSAKDKTYLEQKRANPLFYSPRIASEIKVFKPDAISPQLGKILSSIKPGHFSKVLPNGSGGFICFYLQSVGKPVKTTLLHVKAQIINQLMMQKRKEVLSRYFKQLKLNSNIRIIRLPKTAGQ